MGTAKHRASKRNLAGFALPVIAALLIVASLAATTLLLEHNREAVWKPQSDTKKQLQSVSDSLVKFQRAFHRLPCPAPHDQLPSSANFGLEGTGCSLGSAINGVERYDIGGGKFMRVGVLPVRTLGLTEAYNADKWGNRLTYVVIESLTDPITFSDETGTLKLISENGTTITDGAFAIVAHGKDGKGAYSLKSGTVGVSCTTSSSGSGSTGDQQVQSSRSSKNCSYGDNNGEFIMRSSNPQKGVDYFDDQVTVVAMDAQAKGTNLPCRPPTTPTPFTWADATDSLATCSAPFTNMASGDTQTLTNTSSYNSGTAQVRCNNGSLELISSTCTHTPACPASTVTWSGTGENCSVSRGDLEDGESVVLTNTASGRSGSVRVTCTGGVATPSDITCEGSSCPLPWGGTLAHNGTTNAFSTSSVTCGNTCASETRTCSYGSLSGSYTNQSCTAASCNNCTTPWGTTVPHNSSVPAFSSTSVPCGSSCASETRACTNGVLSGSYTSGSCSVQPCSSCTLGGLTINHGNSVFTYAAQSVACGSSCGSAGNTQTRTCDNGTLSGSYGYTTCTEQACSTSCTITAGTSWTANGNSCTVPAAFTIDNGSTGTATDYTDPTTGSATWSCSNGTATLQSGSTCAKDSMMTGSWCTGGSGSFLLHGDVTVPSVCLALCRNWHAAYRSGKNDCCAFTMYNNAKDCYYSNDGYAVPHWLPLSWGVNLPADNTSTPASCTLPWGGSLDSGSSVTAYSSSSVACGSTCSSVSETRTCTNGTLSGSYTNQSCSAASCAASCSLPWGGSLNSGSSVTAYSSSSVACGSNCSSVSQTRTCTNGVLSGTYTNQNCSVAACGGVWERTQIVNYGNLGNGLPAPANTCSLSAINTTCTQSGSICIPDGGGACSPIGSTCTYRVAQSPQLVRVGFYECKTGTTAPAAPTGGTWQYSGGDSCNASACPNYSAGPPSGSCSNIGESCGIPRSDAWCGDSGVVMQVYICQP